MNCLLFRHLIASADKGGNDQLPISRCYAVLPAFIAAWAAARRAIGTRNGEQLT